MTADKAPLCMSSRLTLALVGFLGCVVVYALRSNLSVAIVCMVNQTAVAEQAAALENKTSDMMSKLRADQDECVREQTNITLIDAVKKKPALEGEFVWSKQKQGMVLSAFFWGYPVSQILGGWLAARFGGKVVLGATILGGSLVTLLSPMAARLDFYVLFILRMVMGLFQGVTFPAFHTMWSHWSPPLERSLLTGMTYAGAQIGNVVTMPVSGLLCEHGPFGGWPSVFYILGLVGVLWVFSWWMLVADSPSQHKRISAQEKAYIEGSLAHQVRKEGTTHTPVPWCSVLKSMPVWACVVGHFAGDWGAYIMATCLPSFMNDVLKFDLTSLGFVASIPYIFYFICINLGGFLADTVRKHGWMSTVNTRRAAMIIALGSQALFLVISGYCGCGQETLVVILLTIGVGLSGFQYAGFVVNYLDIAPAFAGPILGIGNTLSCIAGIMAPNVMGIMAPDGTKEQWQSVFWLTAAILVLGAAFFSVFASGDVQPWAMDDDSAEKNGREMKPLKGLDDDTNAESEYVDNEKTPIA